MKQGSHEERETDSLQLLVVASGDGDSEAFGELYDLLYDRVYSYAYRRVFDHAVAEDITATVFYNVMTHIGRFKWKHAGGFYAWVFRITAHEITRYHSQQSRYVVPEDWLSFSDTIHDERPAQDDMSQSNERSKALHAAVQKLPAKLKEVVELYYFANLSHALVAEALRISEGTARVRLHRGLAQLQDTMKGEGYEY